MQDAEQVDEKFLLESGLSPMECATMSSEEKKSFADAIKASKEKHNIPGSSYNSIPSSPVRDESMSEALSPKPLNNAASESNIYSSAVKRTGAKSQYGTPNHVKDNNLNPRNVTSPSTNTKLNEQFPSAPKKNNENGVSAKRSLSLKQEGSEKCDEKENVKDSKSNIDVDVAKSPDCTEEELIPSLMRMVFERQKSTSEPRFAENLYPHLTLNKPDWIKQVGQYFFDLKVAKIRTETRGARWITVSEKNHSLSFLERIFTKSPTTSQKEDSPGFIEAASIDPDHQNRSIVSPERPSNLQGNSPERPNNLRENTPETSFTKALPNVTQRNSDRRQPETTDITGTSKKQGKPENFVENATEKNEENVTNEPEQRGRRGRKRDNRKYAGKAKASGSNVNSPINDDNSKSEYGFVEKEPYTHKNSDYPPLDGTSSTENSTSPDIGHCPVCGLSFPVKELNNHTWHCLDKNRPEEETELVAVKEGSGSDNDVMEVEPFLDGKTSSPSVGQNQTDGCSRSSARIRSMKRTGGELLPSAGRPTKNLRK